MIHVCSVVGILIGAPESEREPVWAALCAAPGMVRSSLGRTSLVRTSTDTTLSAEYGFFAISVVDFLQLEQWAPHQDLLEQGKLVEIERGDTTRQVIFCSHQWLAFDHPDPAGEQMRALQTVLRKLMAGKTPVSSNGMLEAVLNYPMITTGAEWAARLPHMYLWLDYFSIPQPGALVPAGSASDLQLSELDQDGDGLIEPSEQLNGSDHRCLLDASSDTATSDDATITRLVEQLKAAVSSIPSYIERSCMMWVVVPPCKHRNLDTICDFSTWRRRGWCRMEFAASKLACGYDMPLMVIKSQEAPPEYFNPCDMFKLNPARGEFSVESDKDKVNATLVAMLGAKAEWYAELGDVTLARLVKVFGPCFVPREAFTSAATSPACTGGCATPPAASEQTAVVRLERFVGWRGAEEEAAWTAESGWNLLTLAASMDDEAAVDELLARPPDAVRTLLDAKGAKMVVPGNARAHPLHRREPLGHKLCSYAEGMTPLMAAMTFARPSIVCKLLDAGADVHRDGLLLLGERPCTFRGACLGGKPENVRVLLARHPQYAHAVNEYGACALHFAAFSSQCLEQRAVMQALLECGAQSSIDQRHLFVGTPLTAACATYDQDPEAVRMLLEAGADPLKPEAFCGKARALKRVSRLFRALGHSQMRGFNRLLSGCPAASGQAPAHVAAQRGDVALVRVIAQHTRGANAGALKDGKGRTPIQLCEHATAPCKELPAMIQQMFTASSRAPTPPDGTIGSVAVSTTKCGNTSAKPAKKQHKLFARPRGKARYRVAPDAVSRRAEDTITWLADELEEQVSRHASPPLRR